MSEIIRTGIERNHGRGRRWSKVDHLVTVSHEYGPQHEYRWVIPLCGGDAGRASSSDTGELCRKCIKAKEMFNRMPRLGPVGPQERL